MKKRLMAVLLCVCMAAVLLTPYAGVLTADGALRLGVAGADGSLTEGGDDAVLTEGGESGKATDSAPTTVQSAPQEEQPAPQQEQPEPQAEGAPQTEGEAKQPEETKAEQPAQTEKAPESEGEAKQPEETKAEQPAQTEKPALPKYVWDSEKDVVWKDGSEKLALKDYVVKANWTALAYTDPTDRSEAKTYKAGDSVRVCDEIRYDDRDGIERKWSVVLDGSDFYFVLSEALESAPELPAQAPAQTDMKSLFGIGDNVDPANIINPGDTKVRTYVFMYKDTEIIRQSVKNGDTLEPVTAPVGPNERFVKWVIKDTETEVTFGEVSGVTETKEVTVTAVVEKVYTVYFKTADRKLVLDTKQGTRGDKIGDFDKVDVSKYQLAANQSVIGWKNENNETVTSVTIENKDITLTAEIGNGYWITFDSNGGSYVAPAFFKEGQPAAAPANPTKPGYTFENWYTDEELTQKANFGTINTNKTVYAKWTAETNVKYTVIHWWENANDDGYSFHEQEKKSGIAGQVTTVSGKTYTVSGTNLLGESVSDRVFIAKEIEQQEIKGDGSTIVNVYYSRKQYTLSFKENEYSSKNITTITKKWGADINQAEWPTYDGTSNWQIREGYYNGKWIAFTSTMPMKDGKLWKDDAYGSKNTATYYTETLNGEEEGATQVGGRWFTIHHQDITKGTADNTVGEEDRYPITGFEIISSMGTQPGDYYKNAKFYYSRKSYNVVYINTGSEGDKEKPYKYEQDISDAKDFYKPTKPPVGMEGYVFAGWYEDPVGGTKYEFTGKKMPANNITVYANWVPKTFTVTVYDANKTTELDTLDTFKNIPLGGSISADQMPTNVTVPDGDEFLGWVNKADDKPFNFDTKIHQNYELYALVGSKDGYTVTYDKNGGTGDVPSDLNRYAAGTQATVLDKGSLTHPNGKFFLGWATDKAATTADYQPGGKMTIVAEMANKDRVITLYAVWGAKPATTTLTYNANFDESPAPVQHKLEDGTTNLPNNIRVKLYGEGTFTRDGYKLIGWAKTADAIKPDYDFGAEVIVDVDITAGPNILYAVWEQSTTTVTVKIVEGNFGDKTRAFNFHAYWFVGETKKESGTFTLTNGATKDITGVPIGTTLYVKETDSDLTGYVTTVEVWNGAEVRLKNLTLQDGYYTFEVQPGDMIVFTNRKDVIPDTGVILDSLPYVLILAVVALGAAGVVIRRRRHREDD